MPSWIPRTGAADYRLGLKACRWWQEAAHKSGINLADFDPEGPLDERTDWAVDIGLDIAAVYSRSSAVQPYSVFEQVRACVQYAASKRIYCPPEFVCIDEAAANCSHRTGLDRLLAILQSRYALVMIVCSASRLHRSTAKLLDCVQTLSIR